MSQHDALFPPLKNGGLCCRIIKLRSIAGSAKSRHRDSESRNLGASPSPAATVEIGYFARDAYKIMNDIQKLKNKLKSENIKGIALDIDETLSDTNNHWFDHMFLFQPLAGLNKEEVTKRYKFIEHVPGWDNDRARIHMSKLMNSNDFNETIPLIEDANHIVNKIDKIIPIVAYITARPATVLSGTKKWLEKHGFPHANLITRPSEVEVSKEDLLRRNRWKAEILVSLYPEVIGIIDDNIGLAHQLTELNYQGIQYLYGGETKEFSDNKNVVVCPTWQDVLESLSQ